MIFTVKLKCMLLLSYVYEYYNKIIKWPLFVIITRHNVFIIEINYYWQKVDTLERKQENNIKNQMPKIINRILIEFAIIKPTAPPDLTRKIFRTKWIHENTTNKLFECSSCSFVATERRNASVVPDVKSWNENFK